jgi:hypothetical protein
MINILLSFSVQQESNKSEQQLGVVTLDLAKTSKVADGILKKVTHTYSSHISLPYTPGENRGEILKPVSEIVNNCEGRGGGSDMS